MRPRFFALIVAGGRGLRMGSEVPKQFLPIGGKPVLMHTLEKFASCERIILVLPKDQQVYWQELCLQHSFSLPHIITDGGETRYHSVRSGLECLASQGVLPDDVVAIHDGVRPFVSEELITKLFVRAGLTNAVLPYRPLVESLRSIEQGLDASRAVERVKFVAVQTPQVFKLAMLLEAYQTGYKEHYTDDASVWEDYSYPSPDLIEGDAENIKLTSPMDLRLAELFLSN